jgi:tRNA dimethylallyltransferase
LPILVGGTMMYFNALQQGLTTLPKAAPEVRKQLLQRILDNGLASLYQELLTADPITAKKIDPHDSQRIIRALEVFLITGKTLSTWHASNRNDVNDNFINICIMPSDRTKLHNQINKRFLQMLDLGLVAEVEYIYNKWHLTKEHASMRTVGYRQVLAYLLGEVSYEEMIANAQAATRQLAKRQLTWCRAWHSIDLASDLAVQNCANLALSIVSKFDYNNY